jgi:uncharacterized protein YggE
MSAESIWLYKAGTFALACVGVLALFAVYFLYRSNAQQNVRTFTVQGTGSVDVKPNKASVSATLFAEAADQKEVNKQIAEKSDAMFKTFEALKDFKVTKDDIKTRNVSVQPKYETCAYDYRSAVVPPCVNNPKVIGYTASVYTTVSLEKSEDGVSIDEKAGKVFGIFNEIGARDVSGPAWEVDQKSALNEARQKATKEAKEKAQAIADALGLKLGKVVYYNENQGGSMPVPMMAKAMSFDAAGAAESAVSVPMSSGEDKVSLTVDVTYEMK